MVKPKNLIVTIENLENKLKLHENLWIKFDFSLSKLSHLCG
jgi:hypothetical protein